MSVTDIPPELVTPEQRDERIVELEQAIPREWLRFAIVEAVAIFAPFAALLVAYIAGVVSFETIVAGAIVVFCAAALLVTYWLLRRIVPLSRELAALRGQAS